MIFAEGREIQKDLVKHGISETDAKFLVGKWARMQLKNIEKHNECVFKSDESLREKCKELRKELRSLKNKENACKEVLEMFRKCKR